MNDAHFLAPEMNFRTVLMAFGKVVGESAEYQFAFHPKADGKGLKPNIRHTIVNRSMALVGKLSNILEA